jgi:hypothetical protein
LQGKNVVHTTLNTCGNGPLQEGCFPEFAALSHPVEKGDGDPFSILFGRAPTGACSLLEDAR